MKCLAYLATVILLAVPALADDGVLFVKDVSKTPELESEHADIKLLNFYALAQASDGTLLRDTDDGGIVYLFKDDLYPSFTREYAKPLVAFYSDGHVDFVDTAPGFGGHGERDLFGALSLDDGATWRRTNLSKSADQSSWNSYPGDVVTQFTAADDNRVMAVWASRYCTGGSPAFSIDDEEYGALAQLGIDGVYRMPDGCTDGDDATPCLYLDDLFGVAGSQKSIDYADEGFPDVGELPFSCLWAARGTIEPVSFDDAGGMTYDPDGEQRGIIWRIAERLTSGRRDVYRIEAAAVAGAGFVVTWQEDPEGLLPGQGLGPGNGWSGAIAHNKTDIWYSYLPWEAFDLVDDGDGLYGNPLTLEEYFAISTETPKPGIPLSLPIRLTDNNKCGDNTMSPDPLGDGEPGDPYCLMDFDGSGIPDFCESTVTLPTKTGETVVCVAEDGRLIRGNVASTRARTNLRGYDSDGDGLDDSAWVVMAAEESKGLGEDELGIDIDLGKNMFYYTFDMFEPEFVSQGLALNQPAVYPDWAKTGIGDAAGLVWEEYLHNPDETEWLAVIEPDPLYGAAGLESTLYNSEIARRFSMISQSAADAGSSGTVALAAFKQGIIQQGGPADALARRFVMPADFDPMVDNPFDYANMACDEWAFTDGSNPRYIKGLCKSPALNLTSTTMVTCTDANGGDGVAEDECAATFPWSHEFDDYDMSDDGSFVAWVTTWRMCQEGVTLDGVTCEDTDLDDHTWSNPFEIAKGHRGYMDGDFIMFEFGWSPNWKANKVGHDHYNLYVRRSFDGGLTWTTTPATLGGEGTAHCETYRDGDKGDPDSDDTTICFSYGAGEFEQARNLSSFDTVHLTVIDPRYTRTAKSVVQEDGTFLYPDDERDPSKFMASYETGDNTTTVDGEAEPLDMFYSRATSWGDHWELFRQSEDILAMLEPIPLEECAPEDLLDPTNECSFDWLEHHNDTASSEASLKANPAGDFFYAVWSEVTEEEIETISESDTMFRRIMWYFDETGTTDDDIDRFFDLSVIVSGAGSGNVYGDHLGSEIINCGSIGADCSELLAEGLVANLQAVPDAGSIFDGWQGDVVTTDNPLSVPMTEDRTLTAIFQPEYICTIDDLVLTDMICTEDDLYVGCSSVLVQGDSIVTDTGVLTLVAGNSVVFDNGFVVEAGGELEVMIWSHLDPP
jgi:hypothetical protein